MSRGIVKAALFALLAATTAAYVAGGRATEAFESAAWYVLLILFALESGWPERYGGGRTARALHALRALATAAIAIAGLGYAWEGEWLDAANTALWVAVVVLLEVEVRHPAAVARRRNAFAAAAISLYSALAVLVVIWAAGGEWLDAMDGALWLAAFAVIEFDLLRPGGAPAASAEL